MTISELMESLRQELEAHGDREVLVHCHGCCNHAHEIERMKLGGERHWEDEAEAIVIEV